MYLKRVFYFENGFTMPGLTSCPAQIALCSLTQLLSEVDLGRILHGAELRDVSDTRHSALGGNRVVQFVSLVSNIIKHLVSSKVMLCQEEQEAFQLCLFSHLQEASSL